MNKELNIGVELELDDVKGIFPEAFIGDKVSFSSKARTNPLHADGIMTSVICLGSKGMHMFDCADATSVIYGEGARFFGLAGASGDPVDIDGDKVKFLSLLGYGTIKYQIFVVQKVNKKTAKKISLNE